MIHGSSAKIQYLKEARIRNSTRKVHRAELELQSTVNIYLILLKFMTLSFFCKVRRSKIDEKTYSREYLEAECSNCLVIAYEYTIP
jgi:hypothetical protein